MMLLLIIDLELITLNLRWYIFFSRRCIFL